MKRTAGAICILAVCLFPLLALAEELTIVGTGSGPPILKAIGEAFTERNPDIRIVVPRSIGSGGGIKAVGNDEYLVARVAREIKESERHYGLSYTPIALVPIVFYASNNVKVGNLTGEQVLGIYSGKSFNWAAAGGHNGRIRVVRRQDGDSSLGVLLGTFPGFSDIVLTPVSRTTHSDPETIELVRGVEDAIAFGAYSDVKDLPLTVFSLDGVSPAASDYPYYGVLALVYKEENRTGSLAEFIDFALSSEATAAIQRSGGLPVQ